MSNPLISVIVPVYKVEDCLRHSIISIINQTYKNLEIILVDDGSPDNCPQICDSFSKEDSRIKVIHKENGGLSSARNAGLDIFTGEYVAFVDSDDYIHPEYINILYDLISKTGAGMSICNFRRIYSNDENFIYPDEKLTDYKLIDYKEAFEELVGFNSVLYVLAWNKLYKREIFDDVRFPEGKISEDFYASFKTLHRGNKIAVTSNQLYYYYLRRDSIIHTKDNVSDYNIEALDEFDEYSGKLGIDLKAKSLFIRCNCVMEDYWAAFKNKNKDRMKVTNKTFGMLKERMDKTGVPLNHKAKLFYYSKFLFILERGLIDIVGNIKIKLNLYR